MNYLENYFLRSLSLRKNFKLGEINTEKTKFKRWHRNL